MSEPKTKASGLLAGNKDFEALGALVETLNKIASLELKQSASTSYMQGVDIADTLDDLRIVLEPYCHEAGIDILWDIPREIPSVWADRHSLLQRSRSRECRGVHCQVSAADGRDCARR